jgi:hypothetical protein
VKKDVYGTVKKIQECLKLFEALFLEETQTYGWLKKQFCKFSAKLSCMNLQMENESTVDSANCK